MKATKTKLTLLFVIIVFMLTACNSNSSESNIISNAKEIVDKDLSDDISINACLYNKKVNAVYLKFYSFEHGNDEVIILLDDNSVFYEGIYSTIEDNDYDKVIEYGDYTIMKYQIENNDENWIEVDVSND